MVQSLVPLSGWDRGNRGIITPLLAHDNFSPRAWSISSLIDNRPSVSHAGGDTFQRATPSALNQVTFGTVGNTPPIHVDQGGGGNGVNFAIVSHLTPGDPPIETTPSADRLISKAPCMQAAIGQARKVAPLMTTVLICGETGVGKELMAEFIHQNSPRKQKPFVPINCAELDGTLVLDKLFGHDKGSFTGAAQATDGVFHQANTGTLFLDEFEALPKATQATILRAVETQSITRLGSKTPERVNIRFVIATNEDPVEQMHKGEMRPDLFHRINQFRINIPPLRERPQDLEPLMTMFLEGPLRRDHLIPDRAYHLEGPAIHTLKTYHWPGNVRELKNITTKLAIESEDGTITDSLVRRVLEESGLPAPESAVKPGPSQRVGRIMGTTAKDYYDGIASTPLTALMDEKWLVAKTEFDKRYLTYIYYTTQNLGAYAESAGFCKREFYRRMGDAPRIARRSEKKQFKVLAPNAVITPETNPKTLPIEKLYVYDMAQLLPKDAIKLFTALYVIHNVPKSTSRTQFIHRYGHMNDLDDLTQVHQLEYGSAA